MLAESEAQAFFWSLTCRILSSLRRDLLFTCTKKDILQHLVETTCSPISADPSRKKSNKQKQHHPSSELTTVRLPYSARLLKERATKSTTKEEQSLVTGLSRSLSQHRNMGLDLRETVFAAAFRQLHGILAPELRRHFVSYTGDIILPKPQERAFDVEVSNEETASNTSDKRMDDNAGTLYIRFFKAVCREVQSGQAPLFVRTGSNDTHGHENSTNAGDQVLYVPNTSLECPRLTQQPLELYHFMGRLMGVAIRTSVPLPLRFPRSFWKRLAGEPVTCADVFQTNTDCDDVANILESMESMGITKENFESLTTMYFVGRQSDGRVVELFPGLVNFVKFLQLKQSDCGL